MYRSSAKLSAYMAKKYDIPVDRAHIIGHNKGPYPNDHYDPGNGWDWDKYMAYVRNCLKSLKSGPIASPSAASSRRR